MQECNKCKEKKLTETDIERQAVEAFKWMKKKMLVESMMKAILIILVVLLIYHFAF